MWYLGTLAPVIGFIQVGMQARADRYTYVPLTGLFIAIVWECAERIGRLADAIGHFSEAVRLRPDSDAMRVSLGMALAASGDASGGAARLREALTLNPDNRDAQAGLSALGRGGAR